MNDKYLKTAKKAAIKAGNYILSRKGKVRKLSFKGTINLVTDVDKKSEAIIVREILKTFPGHGILAEENYTQKKPARYRWIIDPLDGTTNFAHTLPIYSVSIALEYEDKIIAGVVYDPERKELFSAVKGKGAFLNDQRISVSKETNLRRALLVTGFAYDIGKTLKNIKYFSHFVRTAQAVRRLGSAAIDLCYVACGRFDGFWEMDLKPWDTAAGQLIVTEAGGKITKFDGSPYSCYVGKLLSSNSKLHNKMIKEFKKN